MGLSDIENWDKKSHRNTKKPHHREFLAGLSDDIDNYIIDKVGEEYKIIGWIIWDVDVKDGFDDAVFVFGEQNPVKSYDAQVDHKGDHQGHIWDSFPVYRLVGKIKNE